MRSQNLKMNEVQQVSGQILLKPAPRAQKKILQISAASNNLLNEVNEIANIFSNFNLKLCQIIS